MLAAGGRTLSRPLKSRARAPVGKPVAIVGNGKLFLASLANGLLRRSNVMTDDFVNRFAGWGEKEKVVRHGLPTLVGCR